MKKVECEECGKLHHKGIEIWGAYFCSQECNGEANLRISKGNKCLGCGTFYSYIGFEFLGEKVDYDEWYFCSQECQQKAVRESRKVVKKAQCEECGKVYCNAGNEYRHFCSPGCEHVYDKKWTKEGAYNKKYGKARESKTYLWLIKGLLEHKEYLLKQPCTEEISDVVACIDLLLERISNGKYT